jgi:hypothetical protein
MEYSPASDDLGSPRMASKHQKMEAETAGMTARMNISFTSAFCSRSLPYFADARPRDASSRTPARRPSGLCTSIQETIARMPGRRGDRGPVHVTSWLGGTHAGVQEQAEAVYVV